jgi:hypothetical protein
MTSRFLQNKITFAAVALSFALSFTLYPATGAAVRFRVPFRVLEVSPELAHGPILPPDPWDTNVAHGPILPPDPWDTTVAHSPILPPDPWDTNVAHSPILPPDPWDTVAA